jgi:hypothetical protein
MKTEFYNVYAPLSGKKVTIPVESDYTGMTIEVKVLDKFHKLVMTMPGSYADNGISFEFTGDEQVETPATFFVFMMIDGQLMPNADEAIYLLNILGLGQAGEKDALSVFLSTEINTVVFS